MIWPVLPAALWTLLVAIRLRDRTFGATTFLHPIVLFFGGQAFFLWMFFVVDALTPLRPAERFSMGSVMFLVTTGLCFWSGSFAMGRTAAPPRIEERGTDVPAISAYAVAVVGLVGTILLLRAVYSGSLWTLPIYFTQNTALFDDLFFNSSAAILWQGCIAGLFLLAVSDSVRFRPWLVLVLFSAVVLRAAYLYLVVALFYWIVPLLYRRGSAREASLWAAGAAVLMVLLPIWAVGYRGIDSLLVTLTPYTFGNFSNYNYWFHAMANSGSLVVSDLIEMLYHAGFGSIFAYVQEYFGPDLARHAPPDPFLPQLVGAARYGNVSSIYGSLIRVPVWFAFTFSFFLGALSEWVYRRGFGSTFFQSIYAWMAAAAFLSFAGTGFFTTTRFLPAVLYVWPILAFVRYGVPDLDGTKKGPS